MRTAVFSSLLLIPAMLAGPPAPAVNPRVKTIVDAVSEERITATLRRLEAFGTRGSLSSVSDPEHGVGAARRWIYEQFHACGPRLQVRYDTWHVRKQGRVVRDTDFVNVVAVLPGTLHPDRQFLITAHYDSLALVWKRPEDEGNIGAVDWEKTADAPIAPGVSDDGSGVAAVLELARIMSQYEFANTIVFIAFAGEEQGLIGSTLYAEQARKDGVKIDGVLNNDIIGTDVAGDGRRNNRAVNVYSGDPNDSPSRTVARYVKSAAERYFPAMRVNLVFRDDRFGRGGDHTPFDRAGYGAVRLTTATEDYSHQHNPTDTFANASPAYTALVAKVNAAALASLALAPPAPLVSRISRGKSGYDAVLRWTQPERAPDVAGYVVVMRATTAPDWEKAVLAGNVTEYTLPNASIDDVVFGVKAVDKDGDESLVAPWIMAAHPSEKIETYH
ncbi:MAG: M20/M25/M40 family metallo-hydrolase [Bryobacteraceae bacterium]